MDTYERKKDFICARVQEKETNTYLDTKLQKAIPKRKQVARAFSFEISSGIVRVCKAFFLATLNVSGAYVDHALKHKIEGCYASRENRGRHKPHNKTSENLLEGVRQHIESFPSVESHYCRKDTNRKFLAQDLNITKMYHLYQDKCKAENKTAVSAALYRKVFNEEYDFSFHTPKKDQCLLCFRYHEADHSGTASEELCEEFQQHQERKRKAREEKNKDKIKSQESIKYHTATFHLEAVLSTPCSLVSQLYYKRKLSCYNLSVYSLGNHRATCYMWNECDGQRGSCEIGTCLNLYIGSLSPSVEHITLYSDTCTGQNRNQYVAAAMMFSLRQNLNIKVIDQKFLESGHTHME